MKLKIIATGNLEGIALPQELLARLKLKEGDTLYVTELPDGIKLQTYDPEFERQMEVAERIMREDRELLRRLASS